MAESLSRDTRSSLCIQLINPNTSLGMTEIMAATARQVASPGTEILAVCPDEGAPSIEGHFDEAIATLGVLQQVKAGRNAGVDGHIIACFGDPGLLAARELARAPVVGIAEAAMHMATLVATRFSIVTTLPRTLVIARHLLHQYGFERHCAALHSIDLPVLSLDDGSGLAQQKVREQCIKSKQTDGSGAIVLGCGGMADLAQELTLELGIPVIDGVSAAVRLIESLNALRLTTSKHGDLDYPLPKPLSGRFKDLNN
ncbi:aspartate/glutamate racemase family protein [Rouxiella badensis]|jgi:allantoin racemase|uniref:Asp/Glu racemase n=1 Tax=Rouxiella badensis TaxID=1646377 RepID=A0A1X0WCN7_9GAMM|nr:aspartate/glutamate racemase family protein [Rouxiella badensis]MCC3703927.1 aspartate/glutamate racemase family protein [Rouxiella badensis]MCC3718948.1 aspartate/glutamate racemase family protein [Rouxiella badensis]MCC3729002.1 aspartate/glutamate racemase family protein [Rouxiella badensis]MCC3740553.1 aspartate/glutamate racemase family protein [Rouxiella badensis]ORJ24556.1 Asp/Glu racemase [Rouxiella badensis]